MQVITATISDFEQLAQAPDAEIIRRFFLAARNSKTDLVSQSVTTVAKQVKREPQFLVIGLFDDKQRQVGEFRFAPIPSFREWRL